MIKSEIQDAIEWRKNLGLFQNTECLRIFYGPGEGKNSDLRNLAIDQYQGHFWITQWKEVSKKTLGEVVIALKESFVSSYQASVLMDRSQVASESEVQTLDGNPMTDRFSVKENGVSYLVQMNGTKHPGLFLDHAPLRTWLKQSQKNKSVLNLFSYTGSLSLAAAAGGASFVTTLDLSKPTIDWAKANWENANLDAEKADFIYGDAFEWLPKLQKRGLTYDTILCDPPSFSRSKNGVFSTNKDSAKLHAQIFPLLKKGGVLVTSINSENFSERSFLDAIEEGATATKTDLVVLNRVDLPESFPTGKDLRERYLKGFYLLSR